MVPDRALVNERLIMIDPHPPPCFWEERLQAAENKEYEREKESQEKTRGGKLLKRWDLPRRIHFSDVEALGRELLERGTGGVTPVGFV